MRTVWAPNSVLNAADVVTLVNSCDYALVLRNQLGENGEQVIVRGAQALNDGGAGTWWWDASSSATDDGVLVIKPSSEPSNGRWRRIVTGNFYEVGWWGVDFTGATLSDTAVHAADAAAFAAGMQLSIGQGVVLLNANYSFQSTLIIGSASRLKPRSGVTLTLADTPAILHTAQIFDLSLGGTVNIARPSRPVSPQWWGAQGAAIVATINVGITVGLKALVSTTAQWTQADVSKLIIVPGAGDPGGSYLSELHTSIDAVSMDGKTATVHDAAGTTVSNAGTTRVIYGVDETAPIQAALNCSSAGKPVAVDFPPGDYLYQFGQAAIATLGLIIRALGRARIIGITPSAASAFPILRLTGNGSAVEKLVLEATNGTAIPASVAATSATETASFPVLITIKTYFIDTTSAPFTGTLPPLPVVDDEYLFKDSTGQCGTNAFSLNGNGYTIDGASGTSVIIQVNGGFARLKFNGTQWSVVG